MMANWDSVIITLVFGAIVIAIGIFVMAILRNASDTSIYQKDKYEALDLEAEKTEDEAVGAVVVSKEMAGYWSGIVNTPEYNDCYMVTFLTDNGDKREYAVDKETFERVYEGQTSTLVTVDGKFFAFDDGEDVTIE